MSAATIPIFDPQGVLRDVPQDQLKAAVGAGGKPSVRFQAPDGKIRYVPADRTADAVKAGGTMLPIEQQDVQHPGFWAGLGSDALAMGKSILNAGPEMGTGDQIHQDAEYLQKLKDEGHSFPYRALMSLTPSGMRESAESGDVGGVIGHTVVPVAAAASPLVAEGASRMADSAMAKASPATKAVVGAAPDAVTAAVKKIPSSVIRNIPWIGDVLHDMYKAGAEAYRKAQPALDKGAPLPETPPAEVLQAASLSRGPQPVIDPAQGLGSIPVQPGAAGSMAKSVAQLPEAFNPPVHPVKGPVGSADNPFRGPSEGPRQAPPLPDAFQPRGPQYRPPVGTVDNPHISQESVQQAVEELGTKAPAPSIRARAVEIQQQLNQATGGKPLQPNVSLRNQVPGSKLPDGFSPLESSALKGYKYDPTSKEFETITQGGQHYVYGDVSPEVAAKFEAADSKGGAWKGLREAPGVTLVKKSVNGKLASVKPAAPASASPEGNPRFVYRARDVGEEGIPLSNDHAQATSDLGQAMKYAEAGQRGPQAGQIVRVDLSQLKPSDYVVKTHPNGAKWIQFTRPLTENEVSVFAGKTAGKK